MIISSIEPGPLAQVTTSPATGGKSVTAITRTKPDDEQASNRDSRTLANPQQDRVEISQIAQRLSQLQSSAQEGNQQESQSPFNRG